jgi:hypothetical protein
MNPVVRRTSFTLVEIGYIQSRLDSCGMILYDESYLDFSLFTLGAAVM